MRHLAVLLIFAAAACAPPAGAPETAETEAPATEAAAVDYGPYTGTWDSAEFSRFRHVLHARTPGVNTVTLEAQTTSPGGETVAVYPVGEDDRRITRRIVFVVADRNGESETETFEIPADGAQVEVVVENAGGQRHSGTYTLIVGE